MCTSFMKKISMSQTCPYNFVYKKATCTKFQLSYHSTAHACKEFDESMLSICNIVPLTYIFSMSVSLSHCTQNPYYAIYSWDIAAGLCEKFVTKIFSSCMSSLVPVLSSVLLTTAS